MKTDFHQRPPLGGSQLLQKKPCGGQAAVELAAPECECNCPDVKPSVSENDPACCVLPWINNNFSTANTERGKRLGTRKRMYVCYISYFSLLFFSG